jgi:hypothetical protein
MNHRAATFSTWCNGSAGAAQSGGCFRREYGAWKSVHKRFVRWCVEGRVEAHAGSVRD